MLLPHGAVIALVDGQHFELYRNKGNEADPELAPLPSPKLDESNKGAGVHHRVGAANPSSSRLDEDAHVAAVAGWLNQRVISHKIEALVVIADPRSLGELRKHYHKLTQRALVGELHKDLIGKQAPDILKSLRAK